MSASLYRNQLDRKRKQRVDADRKAGEQRTKESQKRADATRARQAAAKATNSSTVKSKLREADRRDKEAEAAGKEAGQWQTKASSYAREETTLAKKLASAEKTEAEAAERRRLVEQKKLQKQSAVARAEIDERIVQVESAILQMRAPKPEKLRILILGASAEGDLRIGREQKRIRKAVESALHRDSVELDVRPAATTADLLDGITKFRPHVVHFSGHSNEHLLVFEDEEDSLHEGLSVTTRAFAHAIAATDEPPLLVLLNSCHSAAHIDDLVAEVVPFAIGMSDSIEDADAINYAAQFYAATANGQAIHSSHASARAALELAGLEMFDLPTLACAAGADAAMTFLVMPLDR